MSPILGQTLPVCAQHLFPAPGTHSGYDATLSFLTLQKAVDSPTILVLMITLEDLRNIRECLLVGFLEYFSHNSTGIMEEALRDK